MSLIISTLILLGRVPNSFQVLATPKKSCVFNSAQCVNCHLDNMAFTFGDLRHASNEVLWQTPMGCTRKQNVRVIGGSSTIPSDASKFVVLKEDITAQCSEQMEEVHVKMDDAVPSFVEAHTS
ncbi:hypothetical protein VNO78_11528 [Psophocarpus tetragonolobus]|uniref:Uncharacterized protein n=1 Tax=Psophocarpus tetragonolobus TaxID=3891 RepID=A0AAN9SNC6_PSOTE